MEESLTFLLDKVYGTKKIQLNQPIRTPNWKDTVRHIRETEDELPAERVRDWIYQLPLPNTILGWTTANGIVLNEIVGGSEREDFLFDFQIPLIFSLIASFHNDQMSVAALKVFLSKGQVSLNQRWEMDVDDWDDRADIVNAWSERQQGIALPPPTPFNIQKPINSLTPLHFAVLARYFAYGIDKIDRPNASGADIVEVLIEYYIQRLISGRTKRADKLIKTKFRHRPRITGE